MKTNDIKAIINLVVIKTVSFEFFCKTISIFDKYKTLIMRKTRKKNFISFSYKLINRYLNKNNLFHNEFFIAILIFLCTFALPILRGKPAPKALKKTINKKNVIP